MRDLRGDLKFFVIEGGGGLKCFQHTEGGHALIAKLSKTVFSQWLMQFNH